MTRKSNFSTIFKTTFPNGKIYIGQDRTDSYFYIGSFDHDYLNSDFTRDEIKDFTIRKQIIWEAENVIRTEVTKIENKLITQYQSNNPLIGYNKLPKYQQNQRNST
jgi:hypothetical protein